MNDNRDEKTIVFKILRYRPETDDAPHFVEYEIAWRHEMSVLDGLNAIRDSQAPDLSYRSSCRMAVCGSCAVMIDGVARLACKTFIRDFAERGIVAIEPLEHFPIERDLVVDIEDMIAKLESVHPFIVLQDACKAEHAQAAPEAAQAAKPNVQTPQQLEKYRQFAQCIHCGCCYAACPQYKLNRDFLGPAALTLLWRYRQDNRDAGARLRSAIMGQDSAVWSCTSVGYCTEVCPKLVDPAAAIQLSKEQSAFDYIGFALGRK